jgi:hypothetical protein
MPRTAGILIIGTEVLGRFPALQLGSYPVVGEPDHTVLLTLESVDADCVEAALAELLERLPAAGIARVE